MIYAGIFILLQSKKQGEYEDVDNIPSSPWALLIFYLSAIFQATHIPSLFLSHHLYNCL